MQFITLHELKIRYIGYALEFYKGTREQLAKDLGISRRSLTKYMNEAIEKGYNITKSHKMFTELGLPTNEYRLKHADEIINRERL